MVVSAHISQIGARLRNALLTGPLAGVTGSSQIGSPVITPVDRWPGDSRMGAAILAGEWRFHGESCHPLGPPWQETGVSQTWRAELHGFEWLRDLRATGGIQAKALARVLVAQWLNTNQGWEMPNWRSDVIARRLCSWFSQFSLLDGGADGDFRHRLMQSIDRQSRHLQRSADAAPPGLESIVVAKGLIYSGICLADGESRLQRGARLLEDALLRQILPDGGYLERSPSRGAEALCHLVDLNQLIWTGGYDLPPWMRVSIEKLAASIRFFRHGDGKLALFNGGTEDADWRVDMMLAQTDTRGRAPAQLPQTGFQRLQAMRMLVFVDCGFPPPRGFDRNAHAAPLATEVSLGRERIFVNCGSHAGNDPDWRYALRGTAAHTVLTIDDTNSCAIDRRGGIARGPRRVHVRRQQEQGDIWLHADHDGYRPQFGLSCHRRLFVSASGDRLLGEDIILPANRKWVGRTSGRSWQARFHLHPLVRPEAIADDTILLHCASGTVLRFRSSSMAITIAPSVYLGDGTPVATKQLLIEGLIRDGRAILKWALEQFRPE